MTVSNVNRMNSFNDPFLADRQTYTYSQGFNWIRDGKIWYKYGMEDHTNHRATRPSLEGWYPKSLDHIRVFLLRCYQHGKLHALERSEAQKTFFGR
jgi:hypothetical protein